MLITSGDSAIGILKQSLEKVEKETITLYGSRFGEDLFEEHNYRILSRIILCMERECILIIKDLEGIYGSLYDMLNQNYAIVGNRKSVVWPMELIATLCVKLTMDFDVLF